ncbi:MAG TPA: CapA family protein [Pseudonocardia sp.]|nr:CapA family protein [Pseudonocardia sp.]
MGGTRGDLRGIGATVVAACALALTGCVAPAPDGEAPATPAAAASSTAAGPPSFTVVATGDVLIHQDGSLTEGAAAAGSTNGTGYDFSGVLAPVAPLIGAADLAICHLETPVAEPGGPYAGYPSFNVQPQILDALAGAGYDTCSTASNHSLDRGFDGLVRTLDALDARGMGHTGTFRSEAESRAPRLLDVNGVRVGHVSWTYGLNGIPEPEGRPWAVNDFDPAVPDPGPILADAAAARRAGAEVVIASVHCCTEYDPDPDPAQEAVAAALLASPDVDLVLGHHAHVVQPFERVGGKWVAYGLGNHVAEQAREDTYDSVVARFTFTRGDDGRYVVTTAEAIPARIQRGPAAVTVVPTRPGDAAYERVAAVLDRRGATAAGLVVAGG